MDDMILSGKFDDLRISKGIDIFYDAMNDVLDIYLGCQGHGNGRRLGREVMQTWWLVGWLH